jgi:hypothetical protein
LSGVSCTVFAIWVSKPLKKKEQAEKARLKYPERERKAIGIGMIRTKG